MTILFICGCVERGRDGVGDYTFALTKELRKHGHQISILALKDRHVYKVQAVEDDNDNENGISQLRIPYNFNERVRFTIAKSWIEKVNPDLISIQFVIYSYDGRGVPLGIDYKLSRLCKGKTVHIMLHELWIGFEFNSVIKDRLIGLLQQKIISSLLKKLDPQLITTTNGLFKAMLEKRKHYSIVFPLFSNVPILTIQSQFIDNIFKSLKITENYVKIGIFGNIYHDSNLEDEIRRQLGIADSRNKKLVVLGFGLIHAKGEKEFNRLKELFKDRISMSHLGIQSVEHLSSLIQVMDISFSCTPAKYLGKSGVYAALRLHDARIVVPNTLVISKYKNEIELFNQEMDILPPCSWSVKFAANKFNDLICSI